MCLFSIAAAYEHLACVYSLPVGVGNVVTRLSADEPLTLLVCKHKHQIQSSNKGEYTGNDLQERVVLCQCQDTEG